MIYGKLIEDINSTIRNYESDQELYRERLSERTSAQKVPPPDSKTKDELCDSKPIYSSLHSVRGGIYYAIKEELEEIKLIQDQEFFVAYSRHQGKAVEPDYSKIDVQQLKKAFLDDFLKTYEDLGAILHPEKALITKTREQQIKEKGQDYMKLLTRIREFAIHGYIAHQLHASHE